MLLSIIFILFRIYFHTSIPYFNRRVLLSSTWGQVEKTQDNRDKYIFTLILYTECYNCTHHYDQLLIWDLPCDEYAKQNRLFHTFCRKSVFLRFQDWSAITFIQEIQRSTQLFLLVCKGTMAALPLVPYVEDFIQCFVYRRFCGNVYVLKRSCTVSGYAENAVNELLTDSQSLWI